MKTSLLKPYPKNAKKHDKKQIEQVAASIKSFGFNQPIVIDKKGVVIVGHARLEAAKLLNLKDVPVMKVNLSEAQAKAYRLADNKLNESDWDMGLVIDELRALSDSLRDVTGFDSKELLIDELDHVADEEIDLERLGVITVVPPEAPRLKEKAVIYCESIDDYRKVKEAILSGRIGGGDLLGLL